MKLLHDVDFHMRRTALLPMTWHKQCEMQSMLPAAPLHASIALLSAFYFRVCLPFVTKRNWLLFIFCYSHPLPKIRSPLSCRKGAINTLAAFTI
jgi:hypothetical protein